MAGYYLSENDVEELSRIRRKVDNLSGPGVTNSPTSITTRDVAQIRDAQRTPPRFEWFRITAANQIGATMQWTYDALRVVKTSAGYGGYTDNATDTATRTLYNVAEDQHATVTGSDPYGNGATQDNIDAVNGDTGTHALQPVPVGARVLAKLVRVGAGDAWEWWFDRPNGIDGRCEP